MGTLAGWTEGVPCCRDACKCASVAAVVPGVEWEVPVAAVVPGVEWEVPVAAVVPVVEWEVSCRLAAVVPVVEWEVSFRLAAVLATCARFLRGLVLVGLALVGLVLVELALVGLALVVLASIKLALVELALVELALVGLALAVLVMVGLALVGLGFGEMGLEGLAVGDTGVAIVLPGFATRDVVWVCPSSLVLMTLRCLPVVLADPGPEAPVDSAGEALRGLPTCPNALVPLLEAVTSAAAGDCLSALADLCTGFCVPGSHLVPVVPLPCFTDLVADFRNFVSPPLAGLGPVSVGVGGVTSTLGVDVCISTSSVCCRWLLRV